MGQSPPEVPSPRLDQIIDATRVLFTRYGYRRTAMDDIAREAGLAKATLYLHFAGKEDVFRAMLARCREVVVRRCDEAEALEAPLAERLAALLDAYFGTALEWFGDASHLRELRRLLVPERRGGPGQTEIAYRQRLGRFLRTAAEEGELDLARADLTAEALTELVFDAGAGAKHRREQTPEGYRAEMRNLVALIVAGLTPAAAGAPRAARRA